LAQALVGRAQASFASSTQAAMHAANLYQGGSGKPAAMPVGEDAGSDFAVVEVIRNAVWSFLNGEDEDEDEDENAYDATSESEGQDENAEVQQLQAVPAQPEPSDGVARWQPQAPLSQQEARRRTGLHARSPSAVRRQRPALLDSAASRPPRPAHRGPLPAQGRPACRRRTLVTAHFPKRASDDELRLAFDALLGGAAVARCSVKRYAGGNAYYAFLEFRDRETAGRALAACEHGLVVMEDDDRCAWHVQASRSVRAIVGQPGKSAARRLRRSRRAAVGGAASSGQRVPSWPGVEHRAPPDAPLAGYALAAGYALWT